jgi:hypothetical protein
LTTNGVAEQQVSLSPDGRQVLFVASASPTFETYYQGAAFVMPAAGGLARPVAPDFRSTSSLRGGRMPARWSPR